MRIVRVVLCEDGAVCLVGYDEAKKVLSNDTTRFGAAPDGSVALIELEVTGSVVFASAGAATIAAVPVKAASAAANGIIVGGFFGMMSPSWGKYLS